MRRRKLLLLAVLAVGAVVLWLRMDSITRSNYYRIKQGMSREEVKAILGSSGIDCVVLDSLDIDGPGLDDSTWVCYFLIEHAPDNVWIDNSDAIAVHFHDNRVVEKRWFPLSLRKRLLGWLQRWWFGNL